MRTKLSKKLAYRFKQLAGDTYKQAMVEGYVQTFKKGYSVVEIARVTGAKSAKFIHAALVANGSISKGKPGRQPIGSLPTKMKIHLTKRGLSFSQWCAGWGFDQAEVKREVDQKSGAAMAAIKVDFPKYYKLLTGMVVDDFVRPGPFKKQLYSAQMSWDEKEKCYRAEIFPTGAVGYGEDLQGALKSAQYGAWAHEVIERLKALPDKTENEMESIW